MGAIRGFAEITPKRFQPGGLTLMSAIPRDLSEQMEAAYRELRARRDTGGDGMREYVAGLNGAVNGEERARLEAWIRAEECEPLVRRRWAVAGGNGLVPAVIRQRRHA